MLILIAAIFALGLYLSRETICEFFGFMWDQALEYPAVVCFLISLFLFIIWVASQCPGM